VFGLIIAAMAVALVRALWLAISRSISVRRLIASAAAPCFRLQRIAASCGLEARQIADGAHVCALAGVITPIVLVSTGALAAVSDDELRAALHHERAHARRGDLLLAACLSFLVDLLPLPAGDLVETYKTAREFAADNDAVEATDAESLAGALIEFAKGGRVPAGATSLASGSRAAVASRLHQLLSESPSSAPRPARRIAIAAALAAIAIAGVATPAFAGQHPTCTMRMQANP
jgi:Zn-dependent protease with chaperone function